MLSLRGYDYRDLFQGVDQIDMGGNWAELEWNNNWVCFLDTMLQTALPNISVKGLSVPIRLDEAIFDPEVFLSGTTSNSKIIFTDMCKHLDVTHCSGIQFRGIKFSGISSLQTSTEVKPTIFEQTFVHYFDDPNTTTSKETVIELFLAIAIDNTFGDEFIATEVLQSSEPVCNDTVLKTLTATTIDCVQHRVVSRQLTENSGKGQSLTQYFSCIGDLEAETRKSNFVFTDGEDDICKCVDLVKERGFLATLNLSMDIVLNPRYVLVAKKFTESGIFSLYRDIPSKPTQEVISLDVPGFAWIETLQTKLQTVRDGSRVTVVSTLANSGIIGFTKCLIKEPGGEYIRTFQIVDQVLGTSPSEDINNNEILLSQMEKDLVFNIYRK
ncbi:unnamed protein product, partial [Allacma fusca]